MKLCKRCEWCEADPSTCSLNCKRMKTVDPVNGEEVFLNPVEERSASPTERYRGEVGCLEDYTPCGPTGEHWTDRREDNRPKRN